MLLEYFIIDKNEVGNFEPIRNEKQIRDQIDGRRKQKDVK